MYNYSSCLINAAQCIKLLLIKYVHEVKFHACNIHVFIYKSKQVEKWCAAWQRKRQLLSPTGRYSELQAQKKTNDKMLMSCATKQTTSKSKQMRQWNTLAFCCIFLALYVSTRKKRKKAHPVYDYNNVSWLTHNKTKIKDEKGTWQCWS